MARKNKGHEEERIDYLKIVDSFQAGAFKLCRTTLFPLFRHPVLKESDIRPIDLKEDLVKTEDDILIDVSINSYEFFTLALSDYLSGLTVVKESSRAERYKERAFELIEKASQGENPAQNIEDALYITVALLKPNVGKLGYKDTEPVADPDFDITPKDVEVLEEVCDIYMEVYDPSRPGLFRNRDKDEKASAIYTLAYVNSVVFFCQLMQNRGAFNTEEF